MFSCVSGRTVGLGFGSVQCLSAVWSAHTHQGLTLGPVRTVQFEWALICSFFVPTRRKAVAIILHVNIVYLCLCISNCTAVLKLTSSNKRGRESARSPNQLDLRVDRAWEPYGCSSGNVSSRKMLSEASACRQLYSRQLSCDLIAIIT